MKGVIKKFTKPGEAEKKKMKVPESRARTDQGKQIYKTSPHLYEGT